MTERLKYRLLTGPDDAGFCERVSKALEEGYELYGSPAIALATSRSPVPLFLNTQRLVYVQFAGLYVIGAIAAFAAERFAWVPLLAIVPSILVYQSLRQRVEMRREIRALQQKLGMTMVYVTHDQTEAMTMADQVVLLKGGRIEQDAPPADLYARPATAFAARFIGTPPMNVLRLAGKSEHLIGVRPEDMRFADAGLPIRVTSVEFLGADSIVTCAAGGECRVSCHVSPNPPPAP